MIRINQRRKLGIKMLDVYYAENNCSYKEYDIVHFIQNKHYFANAKRFKTIIIDLTKSKEEIFADFNKSLRRSVRRIDESNLVEFFFDFHPTPRAVKEYIKYFDEFSKAKQIYTCDKSLLKMLSKINCLGIVGAREKATGEILIYNTFIQDGIRSRGQYSASVSYKYLQDNEKRKFIANANKALEWYTINLFKNKEYVEYDLGGVTLDESQPEMDGIDHFKMQFGGKIVEEYNYFYANTIKGKIALRVKAVTDIIRSKD